MSNQVRGICFVIEMMCLAIETHRKMAPVIRVRVGQVRHPAVEVAMITRGYLLHTVYR